MRLLFILVFLIHSFIATFAQECKESELPLCVLNGFKDKFSSTDKTMWLKAGEAFIAAFKIKNQIVEVDFASDGKWVSTRYVMSYKEIPQIIKSYIHFNFPHAKISEQYFRETPGAKDHYYVILTKENTGCNAELYFDLEGNLFKQNIPEAFKETVNTEQNTTNIPPIIKTDLKQRYPNSIIQSCEADSSLFYAVINYEGMVGTVEYGKTGVWHSTKYLIPERELPSALIDDMKQNVPGYKMINASIIQDSSKNNYYYIQSKKSNISNDTTRSYYSLAGKFIKRISADSTNYKESSDIYAGNFRLDGLQEEISVKELPTAIISYIKQNYPDFVLKTALLNTATYTVHVKKNNPVITKELIFDIKGNFIGEK